MDFQKVNKANLSELLKSFFFISFDVLNFDGRYLRIGLSESESYPYWGALVFEDVIMMDGALSWTAYSPDYMGVSERKENDLIYKYGLPMEEGYESFIFKVENFSKTEYTICAKNAYYYKIIQQDVEIRKLAPSG